MKLTEIATGENSVANGWKNGMSKREFMDRLGFAKHEWSENILLSGRIDAHADIHMPTNMLKPNGTFPYPFGVVYGEFNLITNDRALLRPLKQLDGPTKVFGNFNLSGSEVNELKNLIGGPTEVSGSYLLQYSLHLISLEGAPKTVGGSFNVHQCPELKSLQHVPRIIGDTLNIYESGITSLVGISDLIDSVCGIYGDWDNITEGGLGLILIKNLRYIDAFDSLTDAFKIIQKYLGQPDQLFDCQAELIEAGFEEYAQL